MKEQTILDIDDGSNFTHKELIILQGLKKFYENKKNLRKFIEYITGSSITSLRVFDWFITNYAKKNRITYKIKTSDVIKKIDVFLEYKAQLDAYTKKYFDPFCRKQKIYYHYGIDNQKVTIITTIGQMNCFKWAISNKIINYLEDNLLEEVVSDMNIISKQNKLRKREKGDVQKGVMQKIIPDKDLCSSSSRISVFTDSSVKLKKRQVRQELSTSIYKNLNIHKEKITIN